MKKIGKIVVIIAILGLLCVFASYTFGPLLMTYTFIKIHSYYVEKMSAVTGLDTYLLNILIALMVIPFIIGLKKLFAFKSRHENRVIGGILLISVLIIYNGSLYYFTRDMYVRPDGGVMKYYDINGNKVEYSDKPGINPRTARRWKKVTAEITPNLKLWEMGIEDFHSVDPRTARWFNPFTGEAELWYCQHADGSFEFYNKPGFHPRTSEPLNPVIKHIYIEWKKREDERIEKLKNASSAEENSPAPADNSPAPTENASPTCSEPPAPAPPASPETSVHETPVSYLPRIDLSQQSVDYGEIRVRGTNRTYLKRKVITITNAGDGDLIINRIADPAYPFVIDDNNCPSRLEAGRKCRISVRFSPLIHRDAQNGFTINRYKSSLFIYSNAGAARVSLSGNTVTEFRSQQRYIIRPVVGWFRYDVPRRIYRRY